MQPKIPNTGIGLHLPAPLSSLASQIIPICFKRQEGWPDQTSSESNTEDVRSQAVGLLSTPPYGMMITFLQENCVLKNIPIGVKGS